MTASVGVRCPAVNKPQGGGSKAKYASTVRSGPTHVRGAEGTVDQLLALFLRRFIRQGSLIITTASGKRYTFGDGKGSPVAVRFTNAKAQRAVLLNPELRLGEAYMDGTFIVEPGSTTSVTARLRRCEPLVPVTAFGL